MESEDQDSEFTVDNVYQQEFQLLKGMFEDHFSSEVIAGVLEDCYGDVNLAVDTLTKNEDAPSSTVENTSPEDTPNVENDCTEVSEHNSDNMAPSRLNYNAASFATITQATTSVATNNINPTRHPPRSRNHMPKIDYWSDQLKSIFASYTDGNRVLIIMRGAPGCGKSYLAKVIVESTVGTSNPKNFHNHIFSADNYMLVDGIYHYDRNRISEVHKKNQAHVNKALCEGRSPVIVDNTNMSAWEMHPYVLEGVKNGYIIEVVEPCNPWSQIPSQLAKRNIHGVPREKIQQMLNNYEGNFSGESLIKYFKLQYPEKMKPPVKRSKPPYQPLLPPVLHKNEKTIPKTKPYAANPERSNNPPRPLVAENLQDVKSSNNETTNNVTKGEASNLGIQLQRKLPIVEKNLDELLKVETEWDNGDSWEMPHSQTSCLPSSQKSNVVKKEPDDPKPQRFKINEVSNQFIEMPHSQTSGLPSSKKSNVVKKEPVDPKPQRSKRNEVSNQFIEPSMLRDDWIDNLPSNCNIASSKKGCQILSQAEIISNNNSNEDKGNTIVTIGNTTVSGYNVEMPKPNDDVKESSSNEDIKTLTVGGRCVYEEKHFKQLRKMFKNVPRAVLRDIFDNCEGDVHWTFCVVMHGIQHNNLERVGDEQSDSEDDEEVDCQCECDKPQDLILPDTFTKTLSALDNISQNETPLIKKKIKKDKILTDNTIQIKKQIENTVMIADHHYSQNYLNMRRRFDDRSVNVMATTSNDPGTSAPSTSVLNAVASTSDTVEEPDNLNDDEYDDEYEDNYDDMSGSDEEVVETVTVNIGMDFVRQLDELYNRQDFEYPAGFKSELSIPRRIMDELNALWIEAISYQMDKANYQSEQMIKQDEEFARKLALQLETRRSDTDEENDSVAAMDPKTPTFKDLMTEECALSFYEKQVKEEWKSKERQDLAAQMTRKKLYELFPDVGQDTLSEMLIAHANSFDNTVEMLLISTGQGHFLDKPNGINKFIMRKEKEKKAKILKAEREAALSLQEYPYLLKEGEEQTELTVDSVREWRDRAQEYLTERDKQYRKADWHLKHQNIDKATHYYTLCALHTSNYDYANNVAAAAQMQLHTNAHPGTNIVDLHFLRVTEAENFLDIFIDRNIQKLRRSGKQKTLLHIITGRGKHSPGRPRVKPAVIRRLESRGLKFRQQNPGLIVARLKTSHLLSDELRFS